MEPLTALAALAPLGIDLGKALINKIFGADDFKPATVDDWLKMRSLDLQWFQAMNNAGGTNPTYLWVEAIKQLQRPFVVAVTLSVWAHAHTLGHGDTSSIDNAASIAGFYLFGERTLFYVRKAMGK